ncbi:MAG: DUF4065 domain-containing protein [Reyranella sp.]|nr:DUF4065 domain-containing protein [Reyranella sp.]
MRLRDVALSDRRSGFPSWVLADQLLTFARRDRRVINAFQMQKLIYLAEGWMRLVHGCSLIREPIEAREFGPVLPDLQRLLRRFAAGPVQRDLFIHELGERRSEAIQRPAVEEIAVLEGIWDAYGAMSVSQLNSLICEPGGPWETARRQQPQAQPAIIPGDGVASFLRDQLKEKVGTMLTPGDDYRTTMMEVARVSVHLTEASVKMYRAEWANAMKDAAFREAPRTGDGNLGGPAARWRHIARLATALTAGGGLLLAFGCFGMGEVGL